MQGHLEAEARDLFSFDKLLSSPAVQELLLERIDVEFTKKYHFYEASLLRNYIRFVVIEVGFGGLTQQRSAQESHG